MENEEEIINAIHEKLQELNNQDNINKELMEKAQEDNLDKEYDSLLEDEKQAQMEIDKFKNRPNESSRIEAEQDLEKIHQEMNKVQDEINKKRNDIYERNRLIGEDYKTATETFENKKKAVQDLDKVNEQIEKLDRHLKESQELKNENNQENDEITNEYIDRIKSQIKDKQSIKKEKEQIIRDADNLFKEFESKYSVVKTSENKEAQQLSQEEKDALMNGINEQKESENVKENQSNKENTTEENKIEQTPKKHKLPMFAMQIPYMNDEAFNNLINNIDKYELNDEQAKAINKRKAQMEKSSSNLDNTNEQKESKNENIIEEGRKNQPDDTMLSKEEIDDLMSQVEDDQRKKNMSDEEKSNEKYNKNEPKQPIYSDVPKNSKKEENINIEGLGDKITNETQRSENNIDAQKNSEQEKENEGNVVKGDNSHLEIIFSAKDGKYIIHNSEDKDDIEYSLYEINDNDIEYNIKVKNSIKTESKLNEEQFNNIDENVLTAIDDFDKVHKTSKIEEYIKVLNEVADYPDMNKKYRDPIRNRMVNELKSKGIKIEYDLNGLYQNKKLDNNTKKKIMRYANLSKQLGIATVNKSFSTTILEKVDNVKQFFEKIGTKLISSEKKEEAEKDDKVKTKHSKEKEKESKEENNIRDSIKTVQREEDGKFVYKVNEYQKNSLLYNIYDITKDETIAHKIVDAIGKQEFSNSDDRDNAIKSAIESCRSAYSEGPEAINKFINKYDKAKNEDELKKIDDIIKKSKGIFRTRFSR